MKYHVDRSTACDHLELVQTYLLSSTTNPYAKSSFHTTKTPNIGRCTLHLSKSQNLQLAVGFVFWLTGRSRFLLFSCKTTDNLSFFDRWKFRILLYCELSFAPEMTADHPVMTLSLWGLIVITFICKASLKSQLERAQNNGWTATVTGTYRSCCKHPSDAVRLLFTVARVGFKHINFLSSLEFIVIPSLIVFRGPAMFEFDYHKPGSGLRPV